MVINIQILLLIITFITSSYIDIKRKVVPNYILISVVFIALINYQNIHLTGLLAGIPFLIGAVIKENSIGGGDIKYISCMGLILGLIETFVGLVLSLIFMILYILIVGKSKGIKGVMLPMIPFLNLGFTILLFLK